MRNRWMAAAGLAAATVALAACGSAASSGPGSSGSPSATNPPASVAAATGIKTASTSMGTVLTDSAGRTLYWFAIDTPTTSKCSGTCAQYWPPLTGKQAAASGVSLSGTFGTIKRAGGVLQATYDGHPLYTYAGDTAAGQVNGNGKNVSGGLWWAATPSMAKLSSAPAPSPSSSSSSGGYGY
jgi:predicted lipoprotein with Yx(FWY)xxD motif